MSLGSSQRSSLRSLLVKSHNQLITNWLIKIIHLKFTFGDIMKLRRRTTLVGLAYFTPLLLAAQTAYPSKPVRVIVPFDAGSTTDIIARAIADKMGGSKGQPHIIDNRGGAIGTIGQAAVASAAPDGLHPHGSLLVAHCQPIDFCQAAV